MIVLSFLSHIPLSLIFRKIKRKDEAANEKRKYIVSTTLLKRSVFHERYFNGTATARNLSTVALLKIKPVERNPTVTKVMVFYMSNHLSL